MRSNEPDYDGGNPTPLAHVRARAPGARGRTAVRCRVPAGLPFGGALALYVRTLLPDVGTWDTAEFQAIGPLLGIAHPTGYPAYTLVAWLASMVLQPFGNEALRAFDARR